MIIPSVVYNIDSEYGRIQIFTDVEEVTKENVLGLFSSAYLLHTKNAVKEDALFSYERGKQAILDREKPIRSDRKSVV